MSENKIRFINSDYKTLFILNDGDKVRIVSPDGETVDREVKGIGDGYHVQVGYSTFHICQFAEIMERNRNTVIPLRASLPDMCYGVLPSSGEIITIIKGESGYTPTGINPGNRDESYAYADRLNEEKGISKAQAAAMSVGSIFGWHVPGADPKNYDEQGQAISPKSKGERDDYER